LDDIWSTDAKSCRKTANIIVKKLRSLTRRSKTANITKRWYYFAAQWHFGDVLQSNIIFCDICCFRSASWRRSSL